jgi:hypothetical protein
VRPFVNLWVVRLKTHCFSGSGHPASPAAGPVFRQPQGLTPECLLFGPPFPVKRPAENHSRSSLQNHPKSIRPS